MGGLKSRRWNEVATRDMLESLPALGIRELRESSTLEPGACSRGQSIGGAAFSFVMDAGVLTISSDELRDRHRVIVDGTTCQFGGVRRWLVCPDCGERRGALYLSGRRFSCRGRLNLAYASDQASTRDRVRLRFLRLRWQMDPNVGSVGWTVPERPSGMRHTRYARLSEEMRDLSALPHSDGAGAQAPGHRGPVDVRGGGCTGLTFRLFPVFPVISGGVVPERGSSHGFWNRVQGPKGGDRGRARRTANTR